MAIKLRLTPMVVSSLMVTACSGAATVTQPIGSPSEAPIGSPTASPTVRPTPTQALTAAVGEIGSPQFVPGRANIFGAGHVVPPSPGGGGGGDLPPVWELPPGSDRIVTFPTVAGMVNPIVGQAADRADAFFYVGEPGWYGNNGGELEVTVVLTES